MFINSESLLLQKNCLFVKNRFFFAKYAATSWQASKVGKVNQPTQGKGHNLTGLEGGGVKYVVAI